MIGSWNVRGINDPIKHSEIRKWIEDNHLSLIAIIETRVGMENVDRVWRNLRLKNWKLVNNNDCGQNGRIWVACKNEVQYSLVAKTDQYILGEIQCEGKKFTCTFVYGLNDAINRRVLWSNLVSQSRNVDNPWIVLGDFNAIIKDSERCGGNLACVNDCEEFKRCLEESKLVELKWRGNMYTWTNNQSGDNRIWRRLDRVMVSENWIESFDAEVCVLSQGISDHAPLVVKFNDPVVNSFKPFRFFNLWVEATDFQEIVMNSWNEQVEGHKMYRVVQKLKRLKKELRKLNMSTFCDISTQAREKLREDQEKVQKNPLDARMLEVELSSVNNLRKLLRLEESFYRQKCRVQWIELGDLNTKFFHKSLVQRQATNRITHLKVDGEIIEDNERISQCIIEYYNELIGRQKLRKDVIRYDIMEEGRYVSEEDRIKLCLEVTDSDVKDAMFSIGSDKAPGADGYSSLFFKKSWHIVGRDVCDAVKDFFVTGKLLKQVNSTIITIIPKVINAELLNDFRPISCCNVVYKCITKIIAKRLSGCLDYLVSRSQSAFVPDRRISDNILLAHELVHNYHKAKGRGDCAMKIDLRKAYDSIHWDGIEEVLLGLRFPEKFIKWIMVCVRTPTFSVMINGKPEGYFQGACGVRQGGPMSPLIFVLVVEYLSRTFSKICDSNFGYHYGNKEMKKKHLCFADDLFVFCKCKMNSVNQIVRALSHFHDATGLELNVNKSCIYFSGVEENMKKDIIDEIGFKEGNLPVCYLGVPLISKRLTREDCCRLVDRITNRVSHWTVRHLTYAGRLQLVNAVLFSMHVYWSTMFILPLTVIREVERICRNFLWKGKTESSKGNMVAWDEVCKKKCEGGLGVKNMILWNRTAIMKHVWELVAVKKSLWANWVIKNKLRLMSYWGITKPLIASWSWRNMVKIRDEMKQCFEYTLGKGDLSFWFDPWVNGKSISDLYPSISIEDSDIARNAKVKDLWKRGGWCIPDPFDEHTEEAWNMIRENFYVQEDCDDCIRWNPNRSGIFTIKSA
ncbi:uncharacterized protein LOC126672659 [Mercurialis annua]|uniref:uncharacterized protein LOC126672659 n=1 Tax=Mercurialis annua TaxID=3986 RepID=UPI00215E1156|nr:uncharacterized protein LOC126672659 [Mercurialis annua]